MTSCLGKIFNVIDHVYFVTFLHYFNRCWGHFILSFLFFILFCFVEDCTMYWFRLKSVILCHITGDLGCSIDAISYLDEACSEQSQCEYYVGNKELANTKPCESDAYPYLLLDYTCIEGKCYFIIAMHTCLYTCMLMIKKMTKASKFGNWLFANSTYLSSDKIAIFTS